MHTIEINGQTITYHDLTDALNYKRPILVKIENGEIGFVDHSYWIELSRIKSRAALIEWIHHLLGKVWMTNEMLEQFIEKVCEYRHWSIYGSS